MLWVRGALFAFLVPGLVAVFIPQCIIGSKPMQPGVYQLGWLLVILGAAMGASSLLSFLVANGTPAIFFTRNLRFLWGEEPPHLVNNGLYRFSRNPMYAGVLMIIFGQAVLFTDTHAALYGAAMFVFFHLVIVRLEEPHLRARNPMEFDRYCRIVPRWFGLPGKRA